MGASPRGRPGHPFQGCKIGNDRPGLHFLVETLLFGQVADALPDLQGGTMAQNRDVAAGGFENVQDDSDAGRFTGAVRAQETADRAAFKREADPVHRLETAETFGHLAQFEDDGSAILGALIFHRAFESAGLDYPASRTSRPLQIDH